MIKIYFLIIDIFLCSFALPFFILYTIFLISRQRSNSYKSYLALIDSANINSIYRKTGTLNVIKTSHYNRLFKKHFIFYHKTKNKIDFFLDDNFVVFERTFYKNFQIFSHLKDIIFIIKIISDNDISVLRATSPFEIGLKGWIAAKITRIPFCVSLHTDIDTRQRFDKNAKPKLMGSYFLVDKMEKFVFSHTKYILPIRESMIEYIVNHNGKKESCYVIPHGIDLSYFKKEITEDEKSDFFMRYNIPKDKKIISFAGRLEKQNYTVDIIKIIKDSLSLQNDAYFFIAGDGIQKKQFEKLARKYRNSIYFSGMIPQRDVYLLRKLSVVNLCLMAGFSLIEACASGNPCISYNVEWHYELVKNGETGFLINENNTQEVVDKIFYLLNNEIVRKKLGKNAQRLSFEKHSIENTNQKKLKVFEMILRENNANS